MAPKLEGRRAPAPAYFCRPAKITFRMAASLPSLLLHTPQAWPGYALLDAGDGAKLERFGAHVVARPEPQALWRPALSAREWEQLAGATFTRAAGEKGEKGQWRTRPQMPEQWWLDYQLPDSGPTLRFRLGLSAFKHVGLFPEQEVNWRWLYQQGRQLVRATKPGEPPPKVLNLFAYTGGATLALRAAGLDVAHLDAVRQVNFWARDNMEASGLDGVRWLVDDALAFCRRQVRKGTRYQGIALDPPAYGRGPDGEKWLLEEHLPELLALCHELLDRDRPHFFLLNLYSLGFSALILDSLGRDLFGAVPTRELGELYVPDQAGRALPLGTFYRFASY